MRRTTLGLLALTSRLLATPLPDGTLEGRVLDAGPPATLVVKLERQRLPFAFRPETEVHVDPTGRFAARGLPAGHYRLSCPPAQPIELDYPLPKPTRVVLRGTVRPGVPVPLVATGPDGRPAARCQVPVHVTGFPEPGETGPVSGGQVQADDTVGAPGYRLSGAVLTDATGHATLDLPAGVFAVRLGDDTPPRWLWLRPDQPAPELRVQGAIARRKVTPARTLWLPGPPAGDLVCRVLDARGRPLVEQGVFIFDSQSAGTDAPGAGTVTDSFHTTDADGRVTLSRRQPGGQRLWAKAAGWAQSAPVTVEVVPGRRTAVTLRLTQPAAHADGRVLTADGRPASGAFVFARLREPGEQVDHAAVWADLLSGGGGHWGAECEPDRGPRALGEGGPLGKVPGLLRRGLCYAVTDAAGRFACDQLDWGRYDFYAVQSTGRRALLAAQTTGATPLHGLALRLKAGARLVVRALDDEYRPLTGQHVRVGDQFGDAWAETDARGVAEFAGLATGRFECEPWQSADRGALLVDGETVCQDLRPPATAVLEGRVTAPTGGPAVGAFVVLPDWYGRRSRGAAWTDAEGRFRLSTSAAMLRAAGAPLLVLHPGAAAAWVEAEALADIQLVAGAPLVGRVRDTQGRPLPAAVGGRLPTWLSSQQPQPLAELPTQPDADGWFALLPRPLGQTTVEVRNWVGPEWQFHLDLEAREWPADDRPLTRGNVCYHAEPSVNVAPDAPPLDVRVTPRARGALAATVPGCAVLCATVPEVGFVVTDTRRRYGTFSLPHVPAGPVTLHWCDEQGLPRGATVTVPAGGAARVKLGAGEPVSVGAVSGYVTDAAGVALEGVRVLASAAGRWWQRSAWTNKAGEFKLDGVPAGPVEVELEDRAVPRRVLVRGGVTARLNLTDQREVHGALYGLPDGWWGVLEVWPARWPLDPRLPSPGTPLYLPRFGWDYGTPADRWRGIGEPTARWWIRRPTGEAGRQAECEPGAGPLFHLHVPPGEYHLRAYAGRGGGSYFDLGHVSLPRRGPLQLCMDLPGEAASLRATVTGGKPATLVLATRESLLRCAGGPLDDTGQALYERLAPGEYVALVEGEHQAPLKLPVKLVAGQVTTLVAQLGAGVTLRGTVARASGVLFVSADGERGYGAAPVDALGRFTLTHLAPGSYTLTLWSPGSDRLVYHHGVQAVDGASVALTW